MKNTKTRIRNNLETLNTDTFLSRSCKSPKKKAPKTQRINLQIYKRLIN